MSCIVSLREGVGGRYADGSRTDGGAGAMAAERDEDALPTCAGRATEGHREQHLEQLPGELGGGLHGDACQPGEPAQRRPQGHARTWTRTGRLPAADAVKRMNRMLGYRMNCFGLGPAKRDRRRYGAEENITAQGRAGST